MDPKGKEIDPRISGKLDFKGQSLTVKLLSNGQHLDMEIAARAKLGPVDSQANKDLVTATFALEKAMSVTVLPEGYWQDKVHGFDRDYMNDAVAFVNAYADWENEKLSSLKNG